MADKSPAPDLQSILANLARLGPQGQGESAGWAASASLTTAPPAQNYATPILDLSAGNTEDPRLRPQNRSIASPKPMIDPASITTWQDGLRCVTKLAAQNSQFATSIRRMMEDQRKNEMRWYAERQALKQTQANRAKSSAQAQSILQSLNSGEADISSKTESVVDIEVELASFDRKIYAAQLDMQKSMTAELKGLGVPFFGTDRSLVVEDQDEISRAQNLDDRPKWSAIVTETQLLELRRRMIEHLEDLYRD